MRFRIAFLLTAAIPAGVHAAAVADTAAAADVAADAATTDATSAPADIVVTASKLNAARAAIQPEIGASLYAFDSAAIEALPGGRNVELNQVLLRAPGVVQDSFGQIHIRGDHNDIQYRINGVILPEGLNVFGQSISPRFADKIALITGALPAQYGLRTGGIVNIQTRGTGFDDGGSVSVYGGSHGQIEPSFEVSGSSGRTSYFVSGSYKHTELGIESPDGSSTPLHDNSDQATGFAYVDHILSDNSKLSFILGTSHSFFQIPNNHGAQPALGLTVNGVSNFPSEAIDDRQRETTHYAIASYLYTADRFTGQLSVFGRYSSLFYTPSPAIADLLYTGIAQRAYKRDVAFGGQAEGKYDLTPAHTIRAGFVYQQDRSTSNTSSLVLPTDPVSGVQTSDVPFTIYDSSANTARTYSAYIQDEWKPFDALIINYGLRFDRFEGYLSEQQLSPRINAVLTPVDGTTIHGGYSRYFTPPPFELVANDTVAKFVGTSAQFPNGIVSTTPRAERANYYDIGIEQKFGHLTLGIDGYYKDARNLIDEGQFGAPIILTPFNYAKGRVRGVEFSANYNKGPWTAYGNVALSKAQGTDITSSEASFDPATLAYIATHYIYLDHDQTVSVSGGVSWSKDGTKVSVDGIFGSGLRADGDVPNGRKLADYTVINLATSHDFKLPLAGDVEARLDVVNLFDEKYEIRDGTGVGVGAPQFGARRGVFVGFSKLF